jgi:ribosomal protein S6--L-glutamate ligase
MKSGDESPQSKGKNVRIAVLSSGNGWHVRDLTRAASAMGHELAAVSFKRLQAGVACQPVVRTATAARHLESVPVDLSSVDRVLVRTMPGGSLEQVIFRMDVLHRLVSAGVPVLNPPRALETAVDKYLACCRMEAAGLPVPPTVACENADDALAAFEQLGGDVVVKPLFGSEGKGITRVTDPDVAYRVLKTLERLGVVLYLQKFVPHGGCDLRAFVLGDRVLAAMQRRSDTDWRTNVARGAHGQPIELSPAETELALRAADAVGSPIAGVDLLHGNDSRTYVLEVNAVPGWRSLANVTGIDVASRVIRFMGEWKGNPAHPISHGPMQKTNERLR